LLAASVLNNRTVDGNNISSKSQATEL